jgi:hypothetical protein
LHVQLTEGRSLEGRVAASDDQPAGGALITVFRLIDPPQPEGSRSPPRRVLAAESIADHEGRFVLGALADADYELVAWHPQLGRASMTLRGSDTGIVVRLRSSGIARGRVIAGGRPVEGVDVISVPDAGAFAAAGDMTDVKGGDARTGADGRFAVMLAPSGGGELRIGGGTRPVKRVPLPRSPPGVIEIGDVDLGRTIDLAIVLDRDPGCDLRATGPVGRTGLQLISGRRTGNAMFTVTIPEPGLWELTLNCGQSSSRLTPSLLQVRSEDDGREVRVVVR